MNRKCTECRLVNFPHAAVCVRCGAALGLAAGKKRRPARLAVRAAVCALVCLALVLCFYLTLLASAASLDIDQKSEVRQSIALLKERGFRTEAFLLSMAALKSDDNWLNASVAKENAYAATNFPFEIITLYPDFFTYPADTTERAAILLHEAKHLAGADEHAAYEFVWRSRKQLGWTRDIYGTSPVWRNVRQQTKDHVPELFTCEGNELNDCTE